MDSASLDSTYNYRKLDGYIYCRAQVEISSVWAKEFDQ